MKTSNWIRLLAVSALLSAGCGSIGGPASGNAPSVSTTTTVAPCPPPSNGCLALVTFRGANTLVVSDITDINNPKTVGTLTLPSRFVSATDVSYVDQNGDLIRQPFSNSSKTVVAHGAGLFDWSPDGSAVVYFTKSSSGQALHQLIAGQDRVLGSVPPVPAVGCETIASCVGADTWDTGLSYSPDGAHISAVESIANVSSFRLWASDGNLVKSTDSQSPFMSAWSGSALYFRDVNGVEIWRGGTTSSFLPGVAWIRPKASPAGGQIVYEARDAQGWAHAYLVDTTSASVRDLGKARDEPVFLTSRYIWYQGERACTAADQCGTRVAGVPSGKTYIYDLQSGTETESVITSVADIWPHAA